MVKEDQCQGHSHIACVNHEYLTSHVHTARERMEILRWQATVGWKIAMTNLLSRPMYTDCILTRLCLLLWWGWAPVGQATPLVISSPGMPPPCHVCFVPGLTDVCMQTWALFGRH